MKETPEQKTKRLEAEIVALKAELKTIDDLGYIADPRGVAERTIASLKNLHIENEQLRAELMVAKENLDIRDGITTMKKVLKEGVRPNTNIIGFTLRYWPIDHNKENTSISEIAYACDYPGNLEKLKGELPALIISFLRGLPDLNNLRDGGFRTECIPTISDNVILVMFQELAYIKAANPQEYKAKKQNWQKTFWELVNKSDEYLYERTDFMDRMNKFITRNFQEIEKKRESVHVLGDGLHPKNL